MKNEIFQKNWWIQPSQPTLNCHKVLQNPINFRSIIIIVCVFFSEKKIFIFKLWKGLKDPTKKNLDSSSYFCLFKENKKSGNFLSNFFVHRKNHFLNKIFLNEFSQQTKICFEPSIDRSIDRLIDWLNNKNRNWNW